MCVRVNALNLIIILLISGKTPTGEDLADTSQCDETLEEIIAEEKCECSEFEGHTCVKSDQCLDTPKQIKTASKAESQFVVFSIGRPPWCEKSKQATCPNAGETCCKTKITKVEIVPPNTKCGQNRKNFECIPVQVNAYLDFFKNQNCQKHA